MVVCRGDRVVVGAVFASQPGRSREAVCIVLIVCIMHDFCLWLLVRRSSRREVGNIEPAFPDGFHRCCCKHRWESVGRRGFNANRHSGRPTCGSTDAWSPFSSLCNATDTSGFPPLADRHLKHLYNIDPLLCRSVLSPSIQQKSHPHERRTTYIRPRKVHLSTHVRSQLLSSFRAGCRARPGCRPDAEGTPD